MVCQYMLTIYHDLWFVCSIALVTKLCGMHDDLRRQLSGTHCWELMQSTAVFVCLLSRKSHLNPPQFSKSKFNLEMTNSSDLRMLNLQNYCKLNSSRTAVSWAVVATLRRVRHCARQDRTRAGAAADAVDDDPATKRFLLTWFFGRQPCSCS